MTSHPLRGALFENLVLVEALKHRTNQGLRSNLHFYRDSSGLEIDGLMPRGDGLLAFEVKAAMTMHAGQLEGLRRIEAVLPDRFRGRVLVHDGTEGAERDGVRITNARGFASVLGELDQSDGPDPR